MLGLRAFGGKTEVYAKYRPDHLGEAVGVIDSYMQRMRVTCVPGLLILANQSGANA
ncbi:hypothetical protein LDO26_16465 [Luteimonas sp. BDR2-5]|nr:hypothetical protein [Luteimonas sp. BDR2-5]